MNTLIYALGGGAGHLSRALLFAQRFASAGRVTILAGDAAHSMVDVPSNVAVRRIAPRGAAAIAAGSIRALLREGPATLVVDTFPGGLFHEITNELLALATRNVLIRRVVKPLSYRGYDELAARFDEIVLPYAPDADEWDQNERIAAPHGFTGPLVRALAVERGHPAPLVVVGAASTLPPAVRAALPEGWVERSGPLAALPAARAYLGAAAGQVADWSTTSQDEADRNRRYDDQYRRADLLGATVTTGADLAWLLARAAAAHRRDPCAA